MVFGPGMFFLLCPKIFLRFNIFRGAAPGAARAGVDNLTKSLSVEWAEAGVRVNAVAPGSSIYSATAAANYGEDLAPFELARPGVPAKRLGTTPEVTGGAVFSVSSVQGVVCMTSLCSLSCQ